MEVLDRGAKLGLTPAEPRLLLLEDSGKIRR